MTLLLLLKSPVLSKLGLAISAGFKKPEFGMFMLWRSGSRMLEKGSPKLCGLLFSSIADEKLSGLSMEGNCQVLVATAGSPTMLPLPARMMSVRSPWW